MGSSLQLSLARDGSGKGAQWHLFFSSARSSLLKNMKLLTVVVVTLAGLVSGMDVGKGGVYDSPMAQDYYNRFRSKPLLRAKPMVELAPKRMGSTYFNTFMAVP